MRGVKRFFTRFLILTVLLILAFRLYSLLDLKKGREDKVIPIPENKEYDAIKSFTFSSDDEIREWEERLFAQKGTYYSKSGKNAKNCVKAVSQSGASALIYKTQLSSQKDIFVGWKWFVEKFPERKKEEALAKKDEFDFAAQFYVVFYSKFFLNTKAIQYVWAETLPAGTCGTSPYTKNVKVLVLESGASSGWKEEKRNIQKDFLKLFGMPLEKDVAAVAIMSDSDSTRSESCAYYSDIVLGYCRGTRPEKELADTAIKRDNRERFWEKFKECFVIFL